MKNTIIIVVIVSLLALFVWLDLGQYLDLDFLKSQKQAITLFYQNNPVVTMISYFFIYVAVAALSLPGALIMTLAGGAIFGVITGSLLVSFASSIGATLAFLVSRTLLKDTIQSKFSDSLHVINNGVEKEGAFYLFTLRLVPVFPFFIVNLVMGLTPIKTSVFYWVSQLGMLAGTVVYVNAGTQLAQIDSLSGILSPALLGSFALLGIFPLLAKKLIDAIRRKSEVPQ